MKKEKCPCCGYPTLNTKANFEICLLCDWEDDGQNDLHAKEVWGGPNGDCSLEEARENFRKNLIMYKKDRIKTAVNTLEQKRKLMRAYEELEAADEMPEREKWDEIVLLEKEVKGLE